MDAEGACAAVAPQPPTLLSLPDETLVKLFALLSARPGVAFGQGSRDARALAAAHPRLYRLFRHEAVTRLEFLVKLKTRSGTPVNAMRRLLQRFTRATAIAVYALDTTDVSRRLHEVVACAAPRLTVVDLFTAHDLCVSDVRALLAQGRGLEELRIYDCWSLNDTDLAEIVTAAGSRLRVLSHASTCCVHSKFMQSYSAGEEVTGVGGARLRDQTALTYLDLFMCRGLGPATLLSVAALPALASLSLACTKFSAKDAVATLPRMRALRILDISGCYAVGSWLWAALPPTLRVLRVECTTLRRGALEETCAAALTVLHVDCTGHRQLDWAALVGSHTRELRVLSLSESNMCDLEHASADAALQGMPHLESLDFSDSKNVADGIATAVARHPALRFVDFRGTSIGPTGVHALRRWEEDGNPTAVRRESTTAGMIPCKRRAVVAKRRALLGSRYLPRR